MAERHAQGYPQFVWIKAKTLPCPVLATVIWPGSQQVAASPGTGIAGPATGTARLPRCPYPLRLGAVRAKKLAKKDIEGDFETLAQPGALFLLNEVR